MIKEINRIIKDDLKDIIIEKLPWHRLKNKIILITGGNGFLASYIIKSLLSANIHYKLNLKILCLVRNKTSKLNRLKSRNLFRINKCFNDLFLTISPLFSNV